MALKWLGSGQFLQAKREKSFSCNTASTLSCLRNTFINAKLHVLHIKPNPSTKIENWFAANGCACCHSDARRAPGVSCQDVCCVPAAIIRDRRMCGSNMGGRTEREDATNSWWVCVFWCLHRLPPPDHPGSGPGWDVWSVQRSAGLKNAGAEEGTPWSNPGSDRPEDKRCTFRLQCRVPWCHVTVWTLTDLQDLGGFSLHIQAHRIISHECKIPHNRDEAAQLKHSKSIKYTMEDFVC